MSDILRSHLRASDIAARMGGDEFAVILDEGNPEGAEFVAAKLVEAMQASDQNKAGVAPVTLSIGITIIDAAVSSSPDLVLHRADQAMYNAKWHGGNRFSSYSEANLKNLLVPPLETESRTEVDPVSLDAS